MSLELVASLAWLGRFACSAARRINKLTHFVHVARAAEAFGGRLALQRRGQALRRSSAHDALHVDSELGSGREVCERNARQTFDLAPWGHGEQAQSAASVPPRSFGALLQRIGAVEARDVP